MNHPKIRRWTKLIIIVMGLFPYAGSICFTNAAERIAGRQQAAVVDLSGVEKFLELTAILENDQEPTPEQWEELLSTPGYAVLIKREFGREFFISRFKLAFMPSMKADLEAQMKKDTGFWAQFLPHYLQAKAMRKEIESRAATLRTMDFAEEALKRAKAFLPELSFDGGPMVAFVIFGPDARGYDPVVIDILYEDDREEFLDLVAHEFHHWYRDRMAPDLTRDQDILWVIEQIQLEGIADLINIPAQMRKPAESLSAWEKRYLDYYRKSPEIIRTMDALFAAMQENPRDRRELGAKLKSAVPLSGHPTGFFMAETIIAELGKDALIHSVSCPFTFFLRYHEAAKKKEGAAPHFSERTLALLRALQNRYRE